MVPVWFDFLAAKSMVMAVVQSFKIPCKTRSIKDYQSWIHAMIITIGIPIP